MAKVALLVGVSEYSEGLASLPGAIKDIEAMKKTLENPDISGFDEIKILENPNPMVMQEAIETLFSQRGKNDLALLFFSGHGIKDDRGRLYFATPKTRKTERGDLVKATAVPAAFVQDVMSNSRCKRQLVILDCCFSGAFAQGMTAKSDATVDIEAQLGGEGRAVLTSSTATQYSFESEEQELSVYTCYIVEGLQTGAADTDGDGHISIDELHEYASRKVQEASPTMKPKIFAVEEGFKIHLAKSAIADPSVRYRKAVERVTSQGNISDIGRYTLNELRENLRSPQFTDQQANTIENEVLKPYRDYQRKLQRYEQVFANTLQREPSLSPTTREELDHFKHVLQLLSSDIEAIEAKVSQRLIPSPSVSPSPLSPSASTPLTSPTELKPPSTVPLKWLIGGGAAIAVGIGIFASGLLGNELYSGNPSENFEDSGLVADNDPSSPTPGDGSQQPDPANVADSPETLAEEPAPLAEPSPECDFQHFNFSLPPDEYRCEQYDPDYLQFEGTDTPILGTVEVIESIDYDLEGELENYLLDVFAVEPADAPRRHHNGFYSKWAGHDENGNDLDGRSVIFPFQADRTIVFSVYIEKGKDQRLGDYRPQVDEILDSIELIEN
ncbi:MAG: hypothetical protein F6K09_13350 [Merismopedia sp. SIO2A8]|nr:hypothetical protein [Merismopedia sp. SIO2A8]